MLARNLAAAMAPPLEGLMAVNKPKGISSAQVIRDLQNIFRPHRFFREGLAEGARQRKAESHNQQNRRRNKNLNVKMGHGGTLDPMASGVLVIGVGRPGTKLLGGFIACQKTYEAVALFGCGTDTYDSGGKIVRRAAYSHITKEDVEKALVSFQGEIMQKPPIFSALHFEGKRYYEFAREGKELPVEIKPRPVKVFSLELLDFTTDHDWVFPLRDASNEAEPIGEEGAEKQIRKQDSDSEDLQPAAKKQKLGPEVAAERDGNPPAASPEQGGGPSAVAPEQDEKPPAVVLRMTVSSGFYVRSLIHDLGEILNSAAHMVKLVRTQQAHFELGKNVIEWDDMKAEDTTRWEAQVVGALGTEEDIERETQGVKPESEHGSELIRQQA